MKKANRALRIVLILGGIICGVLGYGYWHASTHASYHIDMRLLMKSDEKPQAMPNAEISFLDETGKVLAQGVSDEKYNYVHLLHPEVGDCHESEKAASSSSAGRAAWQKCFARLSTWIPQWAEKVRMVDVAYQEQQFNKIPVSVSAYNSEWPLWWIPLPHVGGKPYTYYRTTITVDAGDMKLNDE